MISSPRLLLRASFMNASSYLSFHRARIASGRLLFQRTQMFEQIGRVNRFEQEFKLMSAKASFPK